MAMTPERRNLLGPDASSSDSGSDAESAQQQYRPRMVMVRQGRFVTMAVQVMVTLFVAATGAAALATLQWPSGVRAPLPAAVGHGPEDGVVRLRPRQMQDVWSEDSAADEVTPSGHIDCNHFPFLKLVNTTLRNLGGKGPDFDREPGLVYLVRVVGGEHDGEEFELHINVTSPAEDFHPQSAEEIGFQGRYGSINIKAGTSVTIEIEKWDPKVNAHIPFEEFYFTFFDLDQGPNGTATESITLQTFAQAWIANRSDVNVTELSDHRLMLTATTEGSGQDNPKDPLLLTREQFRKAVTVDVKGETKLEVTFAVGPSEEENPRWFSFRGQPTLLCAKRRDGTHEPLRQYGGGSCGNSLAGFAVLLMALAAGSASQLPSA